MKLPSATSGAAGAARRGAAGPSSSSSLALAAALLRGPALAAAAARPAASRPGTMRAASLADTGREVTPLWQYRAPSKSRAWEGTHGTKFFYEYGI